MCFHVSFDQEVGDLLRAERLCSFIGFTADKGSDCGYGAPVADDEPVVAPRRFQSSVVVGLIVGADARDLYCAIRKDMHSEFERDATV